MGAAWARHGMCELALTVRRCAGLQWRKIRTNLCESLSSGSKFDIGMTFRQHGNLINMLSAF
jgi:hypothetical protein